MSHHQILAWSGKPTATHRMHLDALRHYASRRGIVVDVRLGPTPSSGDLALARTAFVQSASLRNLVFHARSKRTRTLYYLHEPTPLRSKISHGDGVLKSLAWHITQIHDCRSSSAVLVGNLPLAQRSSRSFGVPGTRFKFAPLLMPPITDGSPYPAQAQARVRVTYVGRLDERRYLSRFLQLAGTLRNLGYVPTLLSGDTLHDAADSVDLHAGSPFSEELKSRILSETALVWNPKRRPIAQSGVTADALRFGCMSVLTPHDPYLDTLSNLGLALHLHAGELPEAASVQSALERKAPILRKVFDDMHGQACFDTWYLPQLREELAS